MSIESFKQDDILKKNEKLTEKEEKEKIANNLEFQKEKEKLLRMIEKDRKLAMLKSIVERWLLRPELIHKAIAWDMLELSEVSEVLKKIEDIGKTEKIDMILPKDKRISKEEYLEALNDDVKRTILIEKINQILDHLYMLSHPFSGNVYDLFSWLLHILNHNLNKVQEYHIDVKISLLNLKK